MTEKEAVFNSLKPLFKKAREEGLWFHCGYQDLWFSPDELEKMQTEEGRFIWGAVNWTLRNPNNTALTSTIFQRLPESSV